MEVMFTVVTLFIAVVFGIIIVTIVTRAAKNYSEWEHNNRQPVLNVPAVVKAKRTEVDGGGQNRMVDTTYYVTFELEASGVRIEFSVDGREYGLLAEGDRGTLTHQGTRYHGFQRTIGEAPRRPAPEGEKGDGGEWLRRAEGQR